MRRSKVITERDVPNHSESQHCQFLQVRGQVPGGIKYVGTGLVECGFVLFEHMCSMTDQFFVLKNSGRKNVWHFNNKEIVVP